MPAESPLMEAVAPISALQGTGLVPAAAVTRPPALLAPEPPCSGSARSPCSPVEALRPRARPILAPGLVLKADAFPGLQQRALTRVVAGAPNFRESADAGVFGTAQPSIEGIHAALAAAGLRPHDGRRLLWVNLREEPVLYLAGRSYNLRALARPFANLEAPGRSAAEVERLEQRLAAEVIAAARANGGRFTVYDEAPGGALLPVEIALGPDDVRTPRQVWSDLAARGFGVSYARVPITDEKRPEDQDLDALLRLIRAVPQDVPLVFNCHAGRGRTTTAIVVASLARGRSRSADAAIDRHSVIYNLRAAPSGVMRGDHVERYEALVQLERYLAAGAATSFASWAAGTGR